MSVASFADAPEQSDAAQAAVTHRKILHLVNGEHYSGAERVQDLLALNLPACGYDVGFVTLKSGRFESNRKSTSSPIYPVPMKSRLDLSCASKVARIVRQENYELIHAHTPRSLLVAARAARIARKPLVYHVHSPVGRDCGNWLRNRFNTWIESRMLRQCAQIICVSSSLCEYMRGMGHPPERLAVVHNGVPVDRGPMPEWPDNGVWTIGSVALFRPRKGLETLIRALSVLREKSAESGRKFRLLAVGPFETPEYEQEIRALVAQLGVGSMIEWTGFETDVRGRLQQMQVLSLPSLYGEGLPMVVLEAMAAGLPVVASDVEGVPEAIRDGVDGILAIPGDSQDLATKMAALAASRTDWANISRNSRERQRESLSEWSMTRRIGEIYDRILKT